MLNPETGDRHAYLFTDVKEIRVQGGKIEAKQFKMDVERSLTPSQQQLVSRAIRQVAEVFEQENRNQPAKMNAAMVIACLLYTSPSPRDRTRSRMPSSA